MIPDKLPAAQKDRVIATLLSREFYADTTLPRKNCLQCPPCQRRAQPTRAYKRCEQAIVPPNFLWSAGDVV